MLTRSPGGIFSLCVSFVLIYKHIFPILLKVRTSVKQCTEVAKLGVLIAGYTGGPSSYGRSHVILTLPRNHSAMTSSVNQRNGNTELFKFRPERLVMSKEPIFIRACARYPAGGVILRRIPPEWYSAGRSGVWPQYECMK